MALALHGMMGQEAVEKDTISYNSAVIACEKGAEWQMALALQGMMGQGIAS